MPGTSKLAGIIASVFGAEVWLMCPQGQRGGRSHGLVPLLSGDQAFLTPHSPSQIR